MTDELRRIQRYGWKPSLPDARDHVADTSGLAVKPEVDPRGTMPAVYDQFQIGSCTGNAVAGAKEYDDILDGHHTGTPSRIAIYWFERYLEGSPATEDTGAYGRDGFKALRQWGAPSEHVIPYVSAGPRAAQEKVFFTDPRTEAPADSFIKLVKPYRAVRRSQSAMKAVLSNRQTIAFGFSVYESFEDSTWWNSGIMPEPSPRRERMLGGHEILGVGYLAKFPYHALCRNSWGPDFARGGYFLFPWSVIMDTSMSSDFRTIARPLGV